MKEQKLKLVNAALEGEPEKPVLQDIDTGEIFEFSKIYGETITDGDLSHPAIQRILNDRFHTVIGMRYPQPDKISIYFV
jgi:hypothetical protein